MPQGGPPAPGMTPGAPSMAPQFPQMQRPMGGAPMAPQMQGPMPPQSNGLLSMLLGGNGQGGQALGLLKMLAQGAPQSAQPQNPMPPMPPQMPLGSGMYQGAPITPQAQQNPQGGVDYVSLLHRMLGGQ